MKLLKGSTPTLCRSRTLALGLGACVSSSRVWSISCWFGVRSRVRSVGGALFRPGAPFIRTADCPPVPHHGAPRPPPPPHTAADPFTDAPLSIHRRRRFRPLPQPPPPSHPPLVQAAFADLPQLPDVPLRLLDDDSTETTLLALAEGRHVVIGELRARVQSRVQSRVRAIRLSPPPPLPTSRTMVTRGGAILFVRPADATPPTRSRRADFWTTRCERCPAALTKLNKFAEGWDQVRPPGVLTTTPHYTTPHHTASRHTTPHHATPRHATPRHTTPHHATPPTHGYSK